MKKLIDVIKLTGNKDLDNLLLILIAIKLKESSSEAGTYNFLISEIDALNKLYKTFMINSKSVVDFNRAFSWYDILDEIVSNSNYVKEKVIIQLDGDLVALKLSSVDDIRLCVYLMVALIMEDKSFITSLTPYHTLIEGYRQKAKSTRVQDGILCVECLLCNSFDDFKPIYTFREVIYETSRYYVSIKGDIVYK